MIDVHCHLEFMDSPQAVVDEARKKMAAIVTSIADPAHFEQTIKLREENKGFVFVTAGLHPTRVGETEKYMETIRKNQSAIAGIGETGLDYKEQADKEKSKEAFLKFIGLANELKKPLVIHCRDAFSDCLDMLKNAETPVVLHCFTGSNEDLQECLSREYWLSYATIVCKSKSIRKLAKQTPLEYMLLETDAPWLDPESNGLTNRPWKIEKSAEIIAKLKGVAKDEVLSATTENARKVFGI